MSLQQKNFDCPDEAINAVDELVREVKEQGVTDAETAGEMFSEIGKNHNVLVEGQHNVEDEHNYTIISEGLLVELLRIGLDIHNHELE